MRHQHLPHAAAGAARRHGGVGGHELRDVRRGARREPDLPRDRVRRRDGRARRTTSSRACSSKTFPTACSTSATRRRAAAAGSTCSSRIRRTRISRPIFTAKRGRMAIDRAKRTVDLVLEDGTRHSTNLRDPAKYEVTRFSEFIIGLDPNTVFPATEILKGDNEMTMAELRARAAELRRAGTSPHGPLMALHRKFAIPGGLLHLRADRARAGPHERPRRQAGELRARDRSGLRLLRDRLPRAADGEGTDRSALARNLGAEHRAGRRGASRCSSGAPARLIGLCA